MRTAVFRQTVSRFGPPVAALPGGPDAVDAVALHQQVSDETHPHARMQALLRLHLRYPGSASPAWGDAVPEVV